MVDFGDPYGIYGWFNDTAWGQLHQISPETMVTGRLSGPQPGQIITRPR